MRISSSASEHVWFPPAWDDPERHSDFLVIHILGHKKFAFPILIGRPRCIKNARSFWAADFQGFNRIPHVRADSQRKTHQYPTFRQIHLIGREFGPKNGHLIQLDIPSCPPIEVKGSKADRRRYSAKNQIEADIHRLSSVRVNARTIDREKSGCDDSPSMGVHDAA